MMWPLLLSGIIAITVIFERMYIFSTRLQTSPELVLRLLTETRKGEIKAAIQTAKSGTDQHRPVVDVILTGLENIGTDADHLELAMKNQAEMWMPIIEKRQDILDTVITAAPLMGLLGTITGMMASFQILSEKGVNEPNAITGGVAEALVATATGLMIALVSLVAFNYLGNRTRKLIAEMESASSRLIEALKVSGTLK